MYDAIKLNNFKIDIYDERFYFEEVKNPSYFSYKNWNKLSKVILSV